MPDSQSEAFTRDVANELQRLRVREAARKLFDQESAQAFPVQEGVLAYGELPDEPPELIPGVLLAHGATGIISVKEGGKSLIGLEIESSLLTGQPLWGVLKPEKTVGKTVHFIAEHTSINLQQLFRRTQLPHEGNLRIFGPEHLGPYKLLITSGIRREAAVDFYKKLAEGAGLIVFDPLAAFIQGEQAENDNTPMRGLVDTMIEIAQSTGAACLVLGHQGKPIIHEGRQVKRYTYATRGASAVEDSLTAVHYLEKLENHVFNGNDVHSLKPIHYKGKKLRPFKLMRDKETCRHTLLAVALD